MGLRLAILILISGVGQATETLSANVGSRTVRDRTAVRLVTSGRLSVRECGLASADS